MLKLINENGIVHDFAHKMWWGHNIEGSDIPVVKEFADGVNTDRFTWTVFHFIPIYPGDFIIRNMESGKVGLYEVNHASKKKFPGTSFGPDDCYNVIATWCGYYNKETGQKTIWNGYGIEIPEVKKEIPVFKSLLVLLSVLTLIAIYITLIN